jgi:hypothetical protein
MRKLKFKKKSHVGRIEVTKLTEANIPFISRRSGMKVEELEQMLIVRRDRMIPTSVRYTVVED